MNAFKRAIAGITVASMVGLGMPLSASAGMVGTDEVTGAPQTTAIQAQVSGLLARADVAQALQARGVDPVWAQQRVQSMSEPELQQLAVQLDELPAGGDVVGVLFAVFVILLVTDILGLTKIFPFTRSVR